MASRAEYPAIENILADPLVRAVMKADRVDAAEMESLLRDVSRRLAASPGDGFSGTAVNVGVKASRPAGFGMPVVGDPTKAPGGYAPFTARSSRTMHGSPRSW